MDQNFHISFRSGPMGLTPFLTVSPTVKYPFFMTSLMTRKSFPMGPSNGQTKTKIFRRDVGLTSIQFHHIFLFPCWQSVLITTSLTIFVNHNNDGSFQRPGVLLVSIILLSSTAFGQVAHYQPADDEIVMVIMTTAMILITTKLVMYMMTTMILMQVS